ncbi:MAG TPA: T9SS type A sorting domain-containing protein [Bacteroidales bacterium]|nr:T9SS type A sorting domain-containing protein [Bacteroidales bacterium]
MLICISWNISNGATYHRNLDNTYNVQFINICAGPNDTLIVHQPDTAVNNIMWSDPGMVNVFFNQDTVIVTYNTQGNWYFSSTETGKDFYVYFIQGLPTHPADMAHDSVFAQGTTTINWTLDAENLTAGYSCTYLWDDSSTSKYRTITDTGTYWLRITNDCGSRTDTIHVTIYDPSTGISKYDERNGFISVYPNPATDRVNLTINATNFDVKVYTLFGQVLLSERNLKTIDFSKYSQGTYILKVRSDNNFTTKIIIKQ